MKLAVGGREAFATTGGRPFDAGLPVVMFVHGAGGDRTVWASQTRWFAHHGRAVLAVDLPGHGRSAGPPLATVEEIADWLAATLDAVGAATAGLAGHSMGAAAALECAARHPDRVRALALVGTAPRMPVHPDLLDAAAAGDHRAHELIVDWSLGRRAHLGGSAAIGMWMAGGADALLDTVAYDVLATDLAASNAYSGADQAAARVRCPALVVLGGDDRMTPRRNGEQLAAAIPGAAVEVVPGSGHSLMTERPDAVLAALRSVL